MANSQIPIDIGYYLSDSLPLAAQDCINLYPQNPQTKGASSTGALFRTPGIEESISLGAGEGRGFFVIPKTGNLLSIMGSTLYEQTELYSASNRGTISGIGPVSIADNGLVTCIIVPGDTGYFYDGALTEIDDEVFDSFKAQLGGVTSVTVKDGRFVYTTDEEFFMGSIPSTNNGKDFNALDFEDADVTSDPIVRGLTIKNELYMFGADNIEVYQSDSSLSPPVARILGATIEKGLTSRFSLVEFDNSFLFLGASKDERPAIWRGDSGRASKVSTSAIDLLIQQYTASELALVNAWTYSQDGNTFAGFTFPNETLVYDSTASAIQQRPVWHQRKTGDSRWNVNNVVIAFGEVLVDDKTDGKIGRLNRTILSEYGNTITRSFIGMYIIDNSNTFKVTSVELSTTSGSGNGYPATEGIDPVIELLYSVDGGRIFNSMGNRKIGKLGEYTKRQVWNRIGRISQSVVFKFVMSEETETDFQRLDIRLF